MFQRKLLAILALLGVIAACGQQQVPTDAPQVPTAAPVAGAAPTNVAPSATTAPTSAPPTEPTSTPTLPATTTPTTAPATGSGKPGRNVPTVIVPPAAPIQLPAGFGISVFQSGLGGPRMMTVGPDGAVYVAERGAGRIVRLPDRNADGVSDGVEVIADNLDAPSSIAFFQDNSLYVAETTRVLRLSDPDRRGVFAARATVIDGLPDGGHNTRTVLWSADWRKLYVSIGSSCNVCNEDDERRATIMVYNPDGSGGEVYAKGLRNAVGLALRPGSNEIWATNNGRDQLGDDVPPETVNAITTAGLDFGWPRCHAGDIVDPDFGGERGCAEVTAPAVAMQAHSAPLGLSFGERTTFPAPFQNGLFVAFHGSWNRSEPTGYKVVFIPLNDGTAGAPQDFAMGWLKANGDVWGRPVDVLSGTDGSLYVSDDAGGTIYRIFAVQ